MPYLLGNEAIVLITTENPDNGVDLSLDAVAVKASPTEGIAGGKIIGKLGGVTSLSDTANAIPNVEGISYNPTKESETKLFHGSTLDHIIPLRKKFDVTITLTGEGSTYAKMFDAAPFGVEGGSADGGIITGLKEYDDTIGYRIYIIVGGEARVLYHALMPDDGYKEELDPNKVVVQTLKFVGNMWNPDVPVASLGTPKPI
jgi:hypothetical protein